MLLWMQRPTHAGEALSHGLLQYVITDQTLSLWKLTTRAGSQLHQTCIVQTAYYLLMLP